MVTKIARESWISNDRIFNSNLKLSFVLRIELSIGFSPFPCYIVSMRTRQVLDDALTDIVTGRGVTRGRHELVLDGRPVVDEFTDCLRAHGFIRTTVGDVSVDIGERVPAFFLEGTTAWFGWIFWEKFTDTKARKLWGSVVRNQKGDWAIQIPPTKTAPVYANLAGKIDMDADRPIYL